MICGGYYAKTHDNCRQWNSKEEIFPRKPVHTFKPSRYFHVSWTPVSGKVTYLMGGGGSKLIGNSTTIVKPGVLLGYKGFDLVYPLFGACAIPDPETDSVVITGGNTNSVDEYKITSLYNVDGFVENFGNLNYQRWLHGCTSYVADNKRV